MTSSCRHGGLERALAAMQRLADENPDRVSDADRADLKQLAEDMERAR